jgi:hypothetical protein
MHIICRINKKAIKKTKELAPIFNLIFPEYYYYLYSDL